MDAQLVGTASKGIESLFYINPLVTVLVLLVMVLISLCAYLIKRNEAQNEKVMQVLVNNTAAITEFKEVLRALASKD